MCFQYNAGDESSVDCMIPQQRNGRGGESDGGGPMGTPASTTSRLSSNAGKSENDYKVRQNRN